MQYSTDPKTGNKLSILGFGCMRFPRDFAKTEELILSAIDKGVNYFDTAYVYGNSEVTLGNILHKNNVRDRIYLATKLPHQKCRSYEDFERIFLEQLERLKTDHIDYYLIHNLSEPKAWRTVCELGIEKWIAEKKSTGQIRQIGFSFHGSRDSFMEQLDIYDWDFCQIQYNYLDENYQAGHAGLLRAHEKGLPVIVMEPLRGGKLANGLPKDALKHFTGFTQDRSAASWGFRWLWNQPEVTVVLSCMNSAEQLDDNLKTAADATPGMLGQSESAVYAPVVAALRKAYKIPCTGCNYCMPCPQGVSIPDSFGAYNTSYSLGFIAGLTMYLTSAGVFNHNSSRGVKNCVKCGACEKKCPQKIEIPKELSTVAKRLEPGWMRPILWIVRKVMS